MKINTGDKVQIVSKINSLSIKTKKLGEVIESRDPSKYPFSLISKSGDRVAYTPIYATELNQWTSICSENEKKAIDHYSKELSKFKYQSEEYRTIKEILDKLIEKGSDISEKVFLSSSVV